MVRRNGWYVWPAVALFVFVLACVNLSHTEENISSNDNDQCPPCTYCQSLGTAQHVDLSPPCQLDVVELPRHIGIPLPRQASFVVPVSRSPPAA